MRAVQGFQHEAQSVPARADEKSRLTGGGPPPPPQWQEGPHGPQSRHQTFEIRFVDIVVAGMSFFGMCAVDFAIGIAVARPRRRAGNCVT